MSYEIRPAWWQTLYDDIVADMLLVRKDETELQATVAFLCERLCLHLGSTLFDQCCGIGSLSLPLARQGVSVLGVDQCVSYIETARRAAHALGLACRFQIGDAFDFVPEEPVDAVLNWGTSFGNADDVRNQRMLERAFQGLRPGGRLVLDYQHVARVLRHYQPYLVYRHQGERGETLLVRESRLDLAAGNLCQRWTFVFPDGRRDERSSSVKLYLPHTLAAMLTACGFVDVEFCGGISGEVLTLESPRCIAIARRPQA